MEKIDNQFKGKNDNLPFIECSEGVAFVRKMPKNCKNQKHENISSIFSEIMDYSTVASGSASSTLKVSEFEPEEAPPTLIF